MRVAIAAAFLRRSFMQATVAMTGLAGGLGFGGDVIDLRHSLPSSGEYPKRDLQEVTTIVVHHTATSGTGWGPINEFHRQARGWARIGYHFGASWDGRTFWLNDFDRRTNHCGGCNSHTVGLAMLGNYDENRPTRELEAAMENTVRFIMEVYPSVTTIAFHGEIGTTPTACPGKYGRAWTKALRTRIYEEKLNDVEEILRRINNPTT